MKNSFFFRSRCINITKLTADDGYRSIMTAINTTGDHTQSSAIIRCRIVNHVVHSITEKQHVIVGLIILEWMMCGIHYGHD